MELQSENSEKAYTLHLDKGAAFTCKFTRKSGHIMALHYSDLVKVEYNPDLRGIILDYVGDRVTILGINLMELFDALCDHRVANMVEAHAPQHLMDSITNSKENNGYITQIMVEMKG